MRKVTYQNGKVVMVDVPEKSSPTTPKRKEILEKQGFVTPPAKTK